EDRQVQMGGAALARRHAADHLRAIGDRLLGVEGALAAGDPLADDLGVFVNENGHVFRVLRSMLNQRCISASMISLSWGPRRLRVMPIPSPGRRPVTQISDAPEFLTFTACGNHVPMAAWMATVWPVEARAPTAQDLPSRVRRTSGRRSLVTKSR